VTQSTGETPLDFSIQHLGSIEQPQASLDFGKSLLVDQLRIEVQDANQQEPAHVHVWEIEFENALGE
jgi:hypothetical protein